jgi:hypothetical protein
MQENEDSIKAMNSGQFCRRYRSTNYLSRLLSYALITNQQLKQSHAYYDLSTDHFELSNLELSNLGLTNLALTGI